MISRSKKLAMPSLRFDTIKVLASHAGVLLRSFGWVVIAGNAPKESFMRTNHVLDMV